MRQLSTGAALAALLALSAGGAAAADAENKYSVDGVGRLDCARFNTARAENGPELRLFAGWIDGYASGFNHFTPDTYDITPWQTVELLVLKLAKFCEANPETRFAVAVNELFATLAPQRLEKESPVLRIERNGQALFIYAETAERMRARLKEEGFDAGPVGSGFGQSAAEALAAYQQKNGLPVSGLPDQPTLNALFPR